MPPIYLNPMRLTPATVSLLSHAHLVADTRGHNSVAGEHVLSSHINCDQQRQWSAGLLLDRLVDQQKLATYVSAVVPDESGTTPSGNPPLAEPLIAAMLLAADHSEADARQSVTTADLLIGILQVQGSVSSAILLDAGMRDPSAVAEGTASIASNAVALGRVL
jgi:ATP-dependent Clp protease ATP-binding subunit ClpA